MRNASPIGLRSLHALIFLAIGLLIVVLLLVNLSVGSVAIPFRDIWSILLGEHQEHREVWENIVWKSRFPQSLTALVAGAALSVSGLQMQTVFRNPLAGPSELGISSGASLGVATVVLLSGSISGRALSRMGFVGDMAITASAIVGSLCVMGVIVSIAQRVRGNVVLLIMGVMIGYIATAIIGVLKFFSNDEDVRSYVIWGLGSFAKVSGHQVYTLSVSLAILIPLSFLLIKPLNLLLLGERYASKIGRAHV